jgi:signal transduction histidine kinase
MSHWINIRSFRVRTMLAVSVVVFAVSSLARIPTIIYQNNFAISSIDEYLKGRLNFVIASGASPSGQIRASDLNPLSASNLELCGDVTVSRINRDGTPLNSFAVTSLNNGEWKPEFGYSDGGKSRTVSYVTSDGDSLVLAVSMDGFYANKRIRLFNTILGGLLATTMALSLFWWCLTFAISGFDRIRQTADLVRTNNLAARIDVASMDTEMQPMAINLNAMLDHVNVLHKAQSCFVADASHELRTPLAGIISNSELREGRTVEELRRSLRYCHESALRLNRLVNGLLELTREETSREKPHHRVLVETLLNEAVEQVQSIANAAGVELRIDLSDNSLIVLGDSDELSQVLVNLLSNAIYHSPQGGIVRLQACRVGSGVLFPSLALRVTDEGPGIDKALGARVFERFYRGASEYEGSGLGLAICKAIIDAHGGTISYRPNSPCGTIFEVTLDAVQAKENRRDSDPAATHSPLAPLPENNGTGV